MLKSLSDLFQSIGIHPLVGGFLLGVGVCLLLIALKRAAVFDAANPKTDELARFKNPNAFADSAATRTKVTYHADGADRALPDHIAEKVIAALQDGQKIEAIKIFKDATGLGLKESKEIIETLQRKLGH